MARSKGSAVKDKQIREYRAFNSNTSNVAPAAELDDFDPEKEMDRRFKRVQKRAKLIQKFKEMEPYLPKEEALQYKKELGLIKEDDEGHERDATDEQNLPLLMEVIKSEKDPKTRQLLLMSALGKKGGMNSDMMTLAMMMPQMNQQPPQDNFEKEILRKLVEERFTSGNKSPMEGLKETMEVIMQAQQMAGGGNNPMEELKQNLKDYKEIGLIGDKGGNIEEKKLEFEKQKFEYTKDMEMEKEKMEADKQKNLINLASKSLVKIVPRLFNSKDQGGDDDEDEDEEEEEQPPPRKQVRRQETPQPPVQETDGIRYVCNNNECKREFLITHIEEPRLLACPNLALGKCDHMYELTGDGGIKVYRLTGKDLDDMRKKYGYEPDKQEGDEKEDS